MHAVCHTRAPTWGAARARHAVREPRTDPSESSDDDLRRHREGMVRRPPPRAGASPVRGGFGADAFLEKLLENDWRSVVKSIPRLLCAEWNKALQLVLSWWWESFDEVRHAEREARCPDVRRALARMEAAECMYCLQSGTDATPYDPDADDDEGEGEEIDEVQDTGEPSTIAGVKQERKIICTEELLGDRVRLARRHSAQFWWLQHL